jgi:hypothetical protein
MRSSKRVFVFLWSAYAKAGNPKTRHTANAGIHTASVIESKGDKFLFSERRKIPHRRVAPVAPISKGAGNSFQSP